MDMQERLSIEGLLLQARRVLIARWPWLLGMAAIWSLAAWFASGLPMRLMMDGVISPDVSWLSLLMVTESMVNAAGSAIIIGVVARTGLPARPLAVLTLHFTFAGATVALAMIIYGFGGLLLGDAGRMIAGEDGSQTVLLTYAAIFVPIIYQFGLFVLLGMAVPAAMERLVSPLAAARVSLKLTEGHRLWLSIIAVVWTAAMLAPVYGSTLFIGRQANVVRPLLLLGQMLTAMGIGVLYLELRRLRTARSPEVAASAEHFA